MVGQRPFAREGSSDVAQSKESTHERQDDAVGEIGLESNLIVVKSSVVGQERNSTSEAGAAPYCMLMVRVCVCAVVYKRYLVLNQ